MANPDTAHIQDDGERIGLLADKADNFLQYALDPGPFSGLQIGIRLGALEHGLTGLRDDLRALAIEYGADPETWVELS